MFLNQPFPFAIQKTFRSPQIKPENVEEMIYGNNLSRNPSSNTMRASSIKAIITFRQLSRPFEAQCPRFSRTS
ncbi:Acetyl-CoA acetyltransferase IA [Colletotrichum sp. SAR 10_70]|nr:Acetyl-CoA acetyltransferase IA [Colletotrichum sp. SAR 10_70]KAI8179247.1 Acetyl-CoA acetyltransferase IA [Colletotrichum sp. SAR 10_75]